MQNISLKELFKRDTKGKVRTLDYPGWDPDNIAGIRTISGLVDGKKITSQWNYTEAKNVGKVNATTAKTQADAEALAQWTKNVEKDFLRTSQD